MTGRNPSGVTDHRRARAHGDPLSRQSRADPGGKAGLFEELETLLLTARVSDMAIQCSTSVDAGAVAAPVE
jgi:hypothetical protein